jgi:hypothetical protein
MRELEYTVLELEKESKKTCDFCSKFENKNNKSVHQIRSRSKVTGEWISDDMVCERCEEKYWDDELSKCNRCGRLQTKLDFDIVNGKNVCYCIRNNEDLEEKELPLLPHEEISQSTFYERQINSLQEQLNETEEALEIEREEAVKFQEKSEEWSKRQKQELLDRIKQLEEENGNHKEEIKRLKTQLEQLTSQQVAQIEVKGTKKWPWLKIKGN